MLCIKPKKKPFAALTTSDGLWDNLRGNVYIRPLADSKATTALKAKKAAASAAPKLSLTAGAAAADAQLQLAGGPLGAAAPAPLAQPFDDTDTDADYSSDSDSAAGPRDEDGLTAEQRIEQPAQWVYEFATGLIYPLYDRDRVLTATGKLDGSEECLVRLVARDGEGGGPSQRWLLSLPSGAAVQAGKTERAFDGTLSLQKYPKKVLSLSINALAKLDPPEDEAEVAAEPQEAEQFLLATGRGAAKPVEKPAMKPQERAKDKEEQQRQERERKEREAQRAERMSRRLSVQVFDRVGGGIAYENELEFELIREEMTVTGRTLLAAMQFAHHRSLMVC